MSQWHSWANKSAANLTLGITSDLSSAVYVCFVINYVINKDN